jgi:hypothetical protein
MGAHNGAINDQVFHVWALNEMVMHPFPDSFVAPASEAFIDAVPVAVSFWQKSPLSAAASHPEHCFHEPTAVGFFPDVKVWTASEELKDFGPLVVM